MQDLNWHGDDSIYLEVMGDSEANAMIESSILSGSGDDYITIDGDIKNSQIDAGKGDDVVDLYGSGNATIREGHDEINADKAMTSSMAAMEKTNTAAMAMTSSMGQWKRQALRRQWQ